MRDEHGIFGHNSLFVRESALSTIDIVTTAAVRCALDSNKPNSDELVRQRGKVIQSCCALAQSAGCRYRHRARGRQAHYRQLMKAMLQVPPPGATRDFHAATDEVGLAAANSNKEASIKPRTVH